ncbi:regulator of G-protein signaling domain-containing protein [Lentzea sp. NPDC051208]|uniref:regulator of G-protein signaling domain-containing protein n=1 Tax=Lentzea sp. NPDC051208 TaxID=3154642 RepID=UPI00341D083E
MTHTDPEVDQYRAHVEEDLIFMRSSLSGLQRLTKSSANLPLLMSLAPELRGVFPELAFRAAATDTTGIYKGLWSEYSHNLIAKFDGLLDYEKVFMGDPDELKKLYGGTDQDIEPTGQNVNESANEAIAKLSAWVDETLADIRKQLNALTADANTELPHVAYAKEHGFVVVISSKDAHHHARGELPWDRVVSVLGLDDRLEAVAHVVVTTGSPEPLTPWAWLRIDEATSRLAVHAHSPRIDEVNEQVWNSREGAPRNTPDVGYPHFEFVQKDTLLLLSQTDKPYPELPGLRDLMAEISDVQGTMHKIGVHSRLHPTRRLYLSVQPLRDAGFIAEYVRNTLGSKRTIIQGLDEVPQPGESPREASPSRSRRKEGKRPAAEATAQGMSFQEFWMNAGPNTQKRFRQFCDKAQASEVLDFYDAVLRYQKNSTPEDASLIYTTYVVGDRAINIPHSTKRELAARFEGQSQVSEPAVFNKALRSVREMLDDMLRQFSSRTRPGSSQ